MADGRTGASYEGGASDAYRSLTNSRKYLRKVKGETDTGPRSPTDTYAGTTDQTKRVKSAAYGTSRNRVK